jgi:hypothetical protein
MELMLVATEAIEYIGSNNGVKEEDSKEPRGCNESEAGALNIVLIM